MNSKVLFFLLFVVIGVRSYADLPMIPYAKAVVSPSGIYVFTSAPKLLKSGLGSDLGVMYRISNDGGLNELWRSKMPFSSNVIVADDGMRVILVYDQIFDRGNTKNDVAIEFYNKGSLYQSYTVSDLVDSPKMLRRTLSFYTWLESSVKHSVRLNGFRLVVETVGGRFHELDLDSGKRIVLPNGR